MNQKILVHSSLRTYPSSLFLEHHGILGQHWGVKNGPPYPLGGGDYSESEVIEIRRKRRNKNSIYNKKHFDEVLSKDKTTLSTLSYDPNRTKDAEMFYATHTKLDKHQYNALFNKKVPKPIYDEDGNEIGTDYCLKYRINNNIKSNLKVASEDSGAEAFRKLYKQDRDFYNFVNDEDRMRKYFVDDKYKFKGYREARDVLKKMDDPSYVPTSKDLQTVYRMFNYVIPYDGAGSDSRGAGDVSTQRAKFFKELKQQGYGAVLDTNDAIYGAFKATSPVIVFDTEQVIPNNVKQTNTKDKKVSELITAGRKFLGV